MTDRTTKPAPSPAEVAKSDQQVRRRSIGVTADQSFMARVGATRPLTLGDVRSLIAECTDLDDASTVEMNMKGWAPKDWSTSTGVRVTETRPVEKSPADD